MFENQLDRASSGGPGASADIEPAGWVSGQLVEGKASRVLISRLDLGFTVRSQPLNAERVQILAEAVEDLPPIVVHERSGQVIDGVHRVRAALSRGEEYISAILYDGSPEDAFVLAVRLNTSHGLPLSRAERNSAADRILRTHAHYSNRIIARIVGLSEATIRKRRSYVESAEFRSRGRIGQDGRIRPVVGADGRIRVRQLLAERPAASAREIARLASVSTNTVLDVRRRLASGMDAVLGSENVGGKGGDARAQLPVVSLPASIDLGLLFEKTFPGLMVDPSIRHSDHGRFVLRSMRANWEVLNLGVEAIEAIPDRWSVPVARMARLYAEFWKNLAGNLESRPTT